MVTRLKPLIDIAWLWIFGHEEACTRPVSKDAVDSSIHSVQPSGRMGSRRGQHVNYFRDYFEKRLRRKGALPVYVFGRMIILRDTYCKGTYGRTDNGSNGDIANG